MNSWKKTYVITAICLITAGIIYLMLPLSRKEISVKKTDLINSEVRGETKLYRINDNSIETSQGTYLIDENTVWVANDQEIDTGRARFLGENVVLKQNEEGTVCQVESSSDLTRPKEIRVVLSADLYGESYIHTKVAITSDVEFWSIKDGVVQTYPANSEITEDSFGTRTIFASSKEGEALRLTTPNGSKEYDGKIEVSAEQGGYSIVNEISMEKYIKGVVPAEMPASYGEEAAKVQAVCARSYVYRQWLGTEKFAKWGAHVDDSVKSQVYGGKIMHEVSQSGVEATWGEFLTYNDIPISTNYFSTSCGHTANGNEVWGGNEAEYQQGVVQYKEEKYGDLSNEEEFHAFITDYELNAFDSHSPWFRWNIEVSMDQIQESVNKYLMEKPIVKVVEGNSLAETNVNDIGKIIDIFVYERSETGMAVSLLVIGQKKTVVIEKPTEIRKLLGGLSVTLMNGEAAGERELLPSAFICFEKVKDSEGNLISVKICGGGYGHGVGMSQNGVKGMLEEGYGYREILQHYFPGTEISIL